MVCLARLIRCAIVASGTKNARAISAVVRPPTARRVSASCEAGDSAGWQQRKKRVSVSSWSGGGSSATVSAVSAAWRASTSSRRRRAWSLRIWSVIRRRATVVSHAWGVDGSPSLGHCCVAASRASCTASSQRSNWP
jgi:hypothetical protein